VIKERKEASIWLISPWSGPVLSLPRKLDWVWISTCDVGDRIVKTRC